MRRLFLKEKNKDTNLLLVFQFILSTITLIFSFTISTTNRELNKTGTSIQTNYDYLTMVKLYILYPVGEKTSKTGSGSGQAYALD